MKQTRPLTPADSIALKAIVDLAATRMAEVERDRNARLLDYLRASGAGAEFAALPAGGVGWEPDPENKGAVRLVWDDGAPAPAAAPAAPAAAAPEVTPNG